MLTPSWPTEKKKAEETPRHSPLTCDDFHHYQHRQQDFGETFPVVLSCPALRPWGPNNRTSVEQQFVLNAKSEGRTIEPRTPNPLIIYEDRSTCGLLLAKFSITGSSALIEIKCMSKRQLVGAPAWTQPCAEKEIYM